MQTGGQSCVRACSGDARAGKGKLPPYGWTSKNYVICVCFYCRGTSSYHTTNTLQGRRATLIHRQYNLDWGTSYSRPPIDPYLTSPLLQNPGGATGSINSTWSSVVDDVANMLLITLVERVEKQLKLLRRLATEHRQ